MTRRKFGSAVGAAISGIAAVAAVSTALGADMHEKHVCKGMNDCKGQGGGPKGVAGKNACKGHGGREVPLKTKNSLHLRRQRTLSV